MAGERVKARAVRSWLAAKLALLLRLPTISFIAATMQIAVVDWAEGTLNSSLISPIQKLCGRKNTGCKVADETGYARYAFGQGTSGRACSGGFGCGAMGRQFRRSRSWMRLAG